MKKVYIIVLAIFLQISSFTQAISIPRWSNVTRKSSQVLTELPTTCTLVTLNIANHLRLLALQNGTIFRNGLGFLYRQTVQLNGGFIPANPSLVTAFTRTFIHSDFIHLFGNMSKLCVIGKLLERRWGATKIALNYTAACYLSAISITLANGSSTQSYFGASNAIAAMEVNLLLEKHSDFMNQLHTRDAHPLTSWEKIKLYSQGGYLLYLIGSVWHAIATKDIHIHGMIAGGILHYAQKPFIQQHIHDIIQKTRDNAQKIGTAMACISAIFLTIQPTSSKLKGMRNFFLEATLLSIPFLLHAYAQENREPVPAAEPLIDPLA